MKKFLLAVAVLFGMAISAQAQDFAFGRFRFDLGLGLGIPFTETYDAGAGALFYLEPKFEVIPQVSVGLRWDGTLFAGIDGDGSSSSGSFSMGQGILLTGDYHFTDNFFRPFAGVGLGAYVMGERSISSQNGQATTKKVEGTYFSGTLRGGFDVAHFRVSASYSFALAEELFHYLGITVGLYIGGGKK